MCGVAFMKISNNKKAPGNAGQFNAGI